MFNITPDDVVTTSIVQTLCGYCHLRFRSHGGSVQTFCKGSNWIFEKATVVNISKITTVSFGDTD